PNPFAASRPPWVQRRLRLPAPPNVVKQGRKRLPTRRLTASERQASGQAPLATAAAYVHVQPSRKHRVRRQRRASTFGRGALAFPCPRRRATAASRGAFNTTPRAVPHRRRGRVVRPDQAEWVVTTRVGAPVSRDPVVAVASASCSRAVPAREPSALRSALHTRRWCASKATSRCRHSPPKWASRPAKS